MVKNQRQSIEKISVESKSRPPVVAILGHVDHGKTSLLDYIRKTHVAAKEAGGITQHIGAYQIEYKGRKITFIDTPGHEAFSAMRARGGKVSDLAILVVAADDGVMPQTKESIAHIKAAGIPFLVAINKIDLPNANIEKVKKQLVDNGVLIEEYAGDVVVVPISAKTGQGVDELLEMVLLLADIHGLKEVKDNQFKGVVIEAKLDRFKGPLATIIVKEGKIAVGDYIYSESASAKVKKLIDSQGRTLKEAQVSTPVEVLGFSSVPKVGEVVTTEKPQEPPRVKEGPKRLDVREILEQDVSNEIRLIVKADVAGSLEAILGSFESLQDENKILKIYYSETGDITESDVLLAAATRSLIIGFNVSVSPSARKLAEEEKVLIRTYHLIYELIEELKEGLESLKAEKKDTVLGKAEVIAIFESNKAKVAGCRMIEGRINKNDTVIVKRNDKEIGKSGIASMKHRNTDINEVVEGEFGLILDKPISFTKGDIIVAMG